MASQRTVDQVFFGSLSLVSITKESLINKTVSGGPGILSIDGGQRDLRRGDFVIAAPDRGLLALEVKGGNIEQRDGRWFQNGAPMVVDPRAQGYEFVRKLISCLKREGCDPPALGVGTCFPDVPFDVPRGEADLSRTTVGKQRERAIVSRSSNLK